MKKYSKKISISKENYYCYFHKFTKFLVFLQDGGNRIHILKDLEKFVFIKIIKYLFNISF